MSPGAPRQFGLGGSVSGSGLPAVKKPTVATNPSLPTFVGLLLMILAFFVVLTSISLRDSKKQNAVAASLAQTFSSGANMPRDAATKDEESDQAYVQSLAGQFQAYIPLQADTPPSTGYQQRLRLPMDQVFDAGIAQEKPALLNVLGQLMTALQRRPQDMDYELEIRLAEAQLSDLDVDRAAGIAAALGKLKAPAEKFTIGVLRRDAPGVDIIVRLRPNVRPIGTLGTSTPGATPGSTTGAN